MAENTFLGLQPYTEADAYRFKGRTEESQELFRLIVRNDFTVCYAESGEGKTSLLNAGVFPLLRQNMFFPIAITFTSDDYEHTPDNFDTIIDRCIKDSIDDYNEKNQGINIEYKLCSTDFQDTDHKSALQQELSQYSWWKLRNYKPQAMGLIFTPVFVFDQFEEVFNLPGSIVWTKEFFDWLEDVSADSCPDEIVNKVREIIGNNAAFPAIKEEKDFKAVFSLRKEFIGELDYWGMQQCFIPNLKDNRYCLKALTYEGAKKVMAQQERFEESKVKQVLDFFVQKYSREPEKIIEEKLPVIPALLLSIVCDSLENDVDTFFYKNANSVEIVLNTILERFYDKTIDSVVSKITNQNRDTLSAVTRNEINTAMSVLVDGNGKRVRMKTTSSVLAKINFDKKYKKILCDSRIIRIYRIDGEDYVEIVHDVLCSIIVNKELERLTEGNVFISYTYKDRKWAIRLQHELEHYKIPNNLNGRKDLPRTIRVLNDDLNKDSSTLFSGDLSSDLYEKLRLSKYLIVICSPHSAQSSWVKSEVEMFVAMGKWERIIPFFVKGEPYSDNRNEWLPDLLRENAGTCSEITGVDLDTDGWRRALVKIIASVLDQPCDFLWQRERRKRKKKGALIIFFLSIVMLFFSGYRHHLKSEYTKRARGIINRIEEYGDYYFAKQEALKISPSRWGIIRPRVPEAEDALRVAVSRNDIWLNEAPDAFTPDGKHLVRINDNSIEFISLINGKIDKTVVYKPSCQKKLSPDSTQLFDVQRNVGVDTGNLHFYLDGEHVVWKDKKVVKIGSLTDDSGVDSFVVAGDNEVISRDCRYLLTTEFCKDNYKVHLYDISKKREVSRLDNENYSSAIFDANNTHVALMNYDVAKQAQVLKCYSIEGMQLERTFQLPDNTTDNFSFSPDGTKILYRASHSLLLNLENGSVKQLPSHFQNTVFHPTENYIVVVHENSIVFYDTLANLIDSISLCYKLLPTNYKISSDGRYLLSSHNVVELKHIHVDKVKGCLVKTNQKNNCFYTLSDSVLYKYDVTMMRVVDSLCLSNTVLLYQWKVFGAKVTQMDQTLVDVSCHDEYVATVRDNVMYLWNFKTKRCESTIELTFAEKLEFDKNQDNVLYVFQREGDGISIVPKTRITKLNINGNIIKKENSCPLRYGSIGNGIHNHVGIIDEARYFTTFNDTLLIVDPLKTDSQKMSGVKLICIGNGINNCWISNNKMFVYGNDAILRLYDVNSFKEEQAYQLGNFIYTPQYNVSRKLILFKDLGNINKGSELSSLRVIDTKTSYNYTINKLIEHVPVTNFMFAPDEQHIVYSDHEYTYIIDFQDDRKLVERASAI